MEARSIVEATDAATSDAASLRCVRACTGCGRPWRERGGEHAEYADARGAAVDGADARAAPRRGPASGCSSWPAGRAGSVWPRPPGSPRAARSSCPTSSPR